MFHINTNSDQRLEFLFPHESNLQYICIPLLYTWILLLLLLYLHLIILHHFLLLLDNQYLILTCCVYCCCLFALLYYMLCVTNITYTFWSMGKCNFDPLCNYVLHGIAEELVRRTATLINTVCKSNFFFMSWCCSQGFFFCNTCMMQYSNIRIMACVAVCPWKQIVFFMNLCLFYVCIPK